MTWFILAGAVIASTAVWFVGGVLHGSLMMRLVLIGVVIVVALMVWLVRTVLILRRARTIERGVLSGGGGDTSPDMQAMRDQFRQYLTALKTSPSGKGALATLPWYLVLGAPGSGKTTLLQESGLAFSSLGHGLRSVRGIGGTRNCDWWFTDRAIFLDTAGRYTTQPEDQGEWLAFLDQVRKGRTGGLPVNGIMVVFSVPDMLKDNGAGIAEAVRPLRERIMEVSTRLGVVLPVYVVFTKADLIGGFKDFFAALPRADRRQVWGFSFSAGDRAGRTAEALYEQHAADLMASLTAKRMAALLGDRPVKELSKAVAFPGNFRQVQPRFRSCVAELFQPFPLTDQPLLRGVYFTSALPPVKTGTQPIVAPATPAAAPAHAATGPDVSIFFQPSMAAGARAGADSDSSRSGFFLGDLFSQVILGDGGIANRPISLRRLRHFMRATISYGSIAAGLLISVWLVLGAVSDRALANGVGEAGAKLVAAHHGTDEAVESQARIGLLEALAAVDAHAVPWRRNAIAAVGQRAYFPIIAQRFLQPTARGLVVELNAGLDRLGKEGSFRDLFTLFSAYQQLAGLTPVDGELLSRVLVQTPRLAGGDKAGENLVAESSRHLAYLMAVNSRAPAWHIEADKALLDRVKAALGDNVWIQEGYGELLGALQSGSAKIGREELIGGDNADLLEEGVSFSSAYTAEAWRQEVEPAITEKAEALAERIANLGRKLLSASEIRRRLRNLYARDYQANWLRVISELRPVGFTSLPDAATRLQTLSGHESPYLRLPKTLAQAQVDFTDVDLPVRLPTSDAWLAEGLAVAQELQAAVARFASATEGGNRGRDPAKVEEFCAVLNGFAQRLAESANKLDGDDNRRAAGTCLQNMVVAVHKALLVELSTEVERTWTDTVRAPFRTTCAGKFPFDPAAKPEVELRALAILFNPKNGTFWNAVKAVESLRKPKIMGRELFPVSVDYQRTVAQAVTLRGALFGAESEEVKASFFLVLQQREAVEDQVVAVGDEHFGLFERPDRRYKFEWRQAATKGAKLSIRVASEELTRDEPSAWGVLRLLRAGVPAKRPDTGTQLTWAFLSPKLNKTFFAAAILDAPDLEVLVTGDLLRTFTMPEKIAR